MNISKVYSHLSFIEKLKSQGEGLFECSLIYSQENMEGRDQATERMGVVRHAWQRDGVVPGLGPELPKPYVPTLGLVKRA